MIQTTSRFFDELSKLMVGSSAMAEGLRSEMETVVRSSSEGVLRALDVVPREEFDAMREMVRKTRVENDDLQERVIALETAVHERYSSEQEISDKG